MKNAFFTPEGFYRTAGYSVKWLYGLAAVCAAVAFYLGFFVCPIDATQGNSYRIIFIHVASAWMSMLIYVVMAVFSAAALVTNNKMCSIFSSAMAPTGALMAFLALFSGSFWGRPTWGTHWVWDARLTSELILLFLYLGFLALQSAIADHRRADKACAASGRFDHEQRFFYRSDHALHAAFDGCGLLALQFCLNFCACALDDFGT